MNYDIAVVGMVCNVPGAPDIESFWDLIIKGKEGLRALSPEEQSALNIKEGKNYIPAGGFIDDISLFDAQAFGYTAREAKYMDPQQRLLLQACLQALVVSGNYNEMMRQVGVFASCGYNSYLSHILSQQTPPLEQQQAVLLGNSYDCLATRISHCLNLTGPSLTIQSGCSSALVSMHHARLALLARHCEIALVGGIAITVPQYHGYSYIEGGFASPDGHCRPFSDDAAGTVFSSGYGVVVLKRLEEAREQGDTIFAVIKGTAINNDGAEKASFTAPSVNGQAAVIVKALKAGNVPASSIGYIEAHGTGTSIGDPIELEALQQAFAQLNVPPNWECQIGSVKANVGHLDVAAGIIGFIKTCLILYHSKLPPQINFKALNPKISATTYFRVGTESKNWDKEIHPHRAGVSAFGFGGTNSHVILEEYTNSSISNEIVSPFGNLIFLSAKDKGYLIKWIGALRNCLLKDFTGEIKNIAYTLQVGQIQQNCRIIIKADTVLDLINKLARVSEVDFVEVMPTNKIIDVQEYSSEQIQREWLQGAKINWKNIYLGNNLKKITLPPIPLQAESFWFEKEQNLKEDLSKLKREEAYDKWLYQSLWQEILVTPSATLKMHEPILILGDVSDKVTIELIAYCQEQNIIFCLIESASSYEKITDTYFKINFSNFHEFEKIQDALIANNIMPKLCIYGFAINSNDFLSIEENKVFLNGLLNIIKQKKITQTLEKLIVNITNTFAFLNNDNVFLPNLLIGIVRSIGQENPTIRTQLTDLDSAADTKQQLNQLISTICDDSLLDVCVWRAERAWQISYQKKPEGLNVYDAAYFKKNGVYIITGGLGNVASVYVDFLSQEYNAKLILIGRTVLPTESQWDELLVSENAEPSLRKKISRLKQWKERGYEIYPFNADVMDLKAMRFVCGSVKEEIGHIDGIIHIAGVDSSMHYKILSELDWEHCAKVFQPKLLGMEVIFSVIKEFEIPNCLSVSSISSALAGIGLGAYAASHNLLDAYALKHKDCRIMNWDAWNFHRDNKSNTQFGKLGSGIDQLSIAPDEGIEILKIIFGKLPYWKQLYISTANLSQRYKYWVQRGFINKKQKKISISHPRPSLKNEYFSATTNTQKKLVELWEALLEITPIGIKDNFFELGGHSLLALECIGRLKEDFQYDCPIIELFESPTILELSNKIDQNFNGNNIFQEAQNRVNKRKHAMQAYVDSREKQV